MKYLSLRALAGPFFILAGFILTWQEVNAATTSAATEVTCNLYVTTVGESWAFSCQGSCAGTARPQCDVFNLRYSEDSEGEYAFCSCGSGAMEPYCCYTIFRMGGGGPDDKGYCNVGSCPTPPSCYYHILQSSAFCDID
ncbi:MAG: hypothetical protein CMJ94_07370 [Planctomycetes bacterium]|nr:hypothetical protein [Planctomycetota bacterium]